MTLALLVLLSAPPAAPHRLAAQSFAGVGIDASKAQFFSDYFADQVSASGRVRVTTPAEIAAQLGVERQRQLLGCDEGACVAELVGALDAEGLIVGSVAKIDEELAVQLKVVGRGERLIAAFATRVSSERALLDFLARSAGELVETLAPAPRVSRPWWLLPGVVGVAAAGGGLVLELVALGIAGRMKTGTPAFDSPAELSSARRTGELTQTLGLTLLVAGGVLLVAAALWALIGHGGSP